MSYSLAAIGRTILLIDLNISLTLTERNQINCEITIVPEYLIRLYLYKVCQRDPKVSLQSWPNSQSDLNLWLYF